MDRPWGAVRVYLAEVGIYIGVYTPAGDSIYAFKSAGACLQVFAYIYLPRQGDAL